MTRKRVLLVSFVTVCFAGGMAGAQQNAPPPPKPGGDAPSLADEMKAFQQKIGSIGRVNWTQVATDTSAKKQRPTPTQAWEEVSSVQLNPETCEMHVDWNSSPPRTREQTFFLEELANVVVTTKQDELNHVMVHYAPIQYQAIPNVYSVIFRGSETFTVRDLDTANEIASALRQMHEACWPATKPPAGVVAGPSLEATLNFIVEKLNMQGSSPGGTVDLASCTIFNGALSLRRIEKLTIVSEMEYMMKYEHLTQQQIQGQDSWAAAAGVSTRHDGHELLLFLHNTRDPRVFEFTDQDLADRVAKAMTHAVELCGGGNKDPF